MAPSRTHPIGVGVVGLGNSGWYYHAEGTLTRASDFDLVAVCDADADRTHRAARAFDARPYTSWRQLAADDDVDLVVVALPHHLHREVAVGCSLAGRHVLVEKPMATTVADAEAMVAAAETAGRLLTVFHQRRWDPDYRVITGLVRDGVLGEVWRAETRRNGGGAYVAAGADAPHTGSTPVDWARRRAAGGGAVFLASPHLVDHLLHLFGRRPVSVTARTHRPAGEEVEDYAEIVMDFSGGAVGRAETCPAAPVNPPKWAVYGTRGTLASADGSTVAIDRPGADRRTVDGLGRLRHCDDFYRALARAVRGDGPLPVDPLDGVAVVTVLEAAQRSADLGGVPVAWPLSPRPT